MTGQPGTKTQPWYEVWDPVSRNLLGTFDTEAEAQDYADELDDWNLVIGFDDAAGQYTRLPRRERVQ